MELLAWRIEIWCSGKRPAWAAAEL